MTDIGLQLVDSLYEQMMIDAAYACSEFLTGGRIFHWLSPLDFTGHWPD